MPLILAHKSFNLLFYSEKQMTVKLASSYSAVLFPFLNLEPNQLTLDTVSFAFHVF